MASISFENVGKIYPDGTRAVGGMDLEIDDGEFMVFVGPSGCGKTTALRMVAGLEDVSEGEIRIGDRVVNDVPAKDRDIAMVFQSYALYPHMTVFDNMAFGLRLRKAPKDEIAERVQEAAKLLGLTEYLHRKPRALSGGQRQRVAMGRAIVREPSAFLMDEPLSNLDAKLRVQMRAEISSLQQELKVTTIYVTHDQVEAMTMGDRVAVIRRGELQQVAPPQELYDRPVNLFVAGFIGSPSMNMIAARVEPVDGKPTIRFGRHTLPVHPERRDMLDALRSYEGREVVLGIRPEDLGDSAIGSSDRPTIGGLTKLREPLGAEIVAHVVIEASPAVTDDVKELALDSDQVAVQELQPTDEMTIVARLSPRSQVREGTRVDLAVDTSMLHLFDPQTGLAIR